MNLIYDRTAQDVEEARALRGTVLTPLKGCYNYTDLNRVEAAVKSLAAKLNAAGYDVQIQPTPKSASAIPSGYTRLEYIRSDGAETIDTQTTPENVEIELTFACEESGTVENAMFGSAWATTGFFLLAYAAGGGLRWHSGGGYIDAPVADLTAKHTVICKKGSISIDGGDPLTFAAAGSDSANVIRLFGVTDTMGYSGAKNGVYKLYSCCIRKSGNAVENYVPVSSSDGIVGLYETLSGEFYTSSNGSFFAGPQFVEPDRLWSKSDIVTAEAWKIYLDNISQLRNAFYALQSSPELPAPEDKLDYIGANNIEKLISDIDLLESGMEASYRLCGTFRAGNNAAHLPLKGSV